LDHWGWVNPSEETGSEIGIWKKIRENAETVDGQVQNRSPFSLKKGKGGGRCRRQLGIKVTFKTKKGTSLASSPSCAVEAGVKEVVSKGGGGGHQKNFGLGLRGKGKKKITTN